MEALSRAMAQSTGVADEWQLVGGHPALDFVNTVDWRGRATPQDNLPDYGALLSWARQARLLAPDEAADLARRAVAEPDEAAAVLRRAKELREASCRLFVAGSGGKTAESADLARLNELLRQYPIAAELIGVRGGFAWRRATAAPELGDLLRHLATAA